jgi:hypothetical protein
MEDEERNRILSKLDTIEQRGVETLVAVTRLQVQMDDVPELKNRVAGLERLKWVALGALATGGSSLGMQLLKIVGA